MDGQLGRRDEDYFEVYVRGYGVPYGVPCMVTVVIRWLHAPLERSRAGAARPLMLFGDWGKQPQPVGKRNTRK